MIPTTGKAKLSKELSYPLGAAEVSTALQGCPAFEKYTLSFHDAACWPGEEFRRIVSERLPYRVFRFELKPEQRAGYGPAWYHNDEHWKITVYPILRPLRSLAHSLLIGSGLPAVADWLELSRQPGWTSVRQSLELIFAPAESLLSVSTSSGV